MNTGHDGSLSTAHANSPRDLLARLETMALMSDVDLPVSHVRAQILSALDVVVQMGRLPGGRRVVVEVASVERGPDGRSRLRTVFRHRRAPDGFLATGVVPHIAEALRERGQRVDPAWFQPDRFDPAAGR